MRGRAKKIIRNKKIRVQNQCILMKFSEVTHDYWVYNLYKTYSRIWREHFNSFSHQKYVFKFETQLDKHSIVDLIIKLVDSFER